VRAQRHLQRQALFLPAPDHLSTFQAWLQPQMTKPFEACSLADFVHELQLAARDASGSALSADVVAHITPSLLDPAHTKAVLQRHPRVGGGSGLICSSAADSKRAWRSMLRDLFLSAGVSVRDAAQLCVYTVIQTCAKCGHVRLRELSITTLSCGRWSLLLFSVLEQLHGARVFLRVCNSQGAALVRIQLAPAAQRLHLRTLVPVYELAMEHRQRLRGMGCGGRGMLALLMSQGRGGLGAVPRDCSTLMDRIVRRVAAAHVAATPEGLNANANALRTAGDFAASAKQLEKAISHGHFPSRADLADMLLHGRDGVASDHKRAFALVWEGERLGCHHCQGVMAHCYLFGFGCGKYNAEWSLALARESAAKGSRYGQVTLGKLYRAGEGGVAQDYAAALAQYRLAAAAQQNYDSAQNSLGYMYACGFGVAQDYAKALRWFKLAAAQGFGASLNQVGVFYEMGCSVAADEVEAIRWYKRAAAAGHPDAPNALERLMCM
jgi:TPR repeat protein